MARNTSTRREQEERQEMKAAAGYVHGLMALVVLLPWLSASAGAVYKCKQADGSVTFSDSACPDDTISREHKGESRKWVTPKDSSDEDADYGDVANEDSAHGPYSITEQVRRIESKKQATRRQTEIESRSADAVTPVEPVMTYEEARRRAVKDAGYRKYGNLTQSQRERVHREMAKYNHLPPSQEPNPSISQHQTEVERARIARENEQQRAREVEHTYETEKLYQQAGVPGREHQYQQADRACNGTFMADCK